MKQKIIGTFITIILLLMTFSVLGYEINDIDTIEMEESITIELSEAQGYIGTNLKIKNIGQDVLNNVEWSFRYKAAITGTGIFINEKTQTGIIEEIEPGEEITLAFRPFNNQFFSPFGIGNIYLNASAQINDIKLRTQQRAFIASIFLFMYKETYKDIKPAEAYERWLNQEFDLIIDVVGLDIYSLGHLPGAVNYIWADGTLRSKIPELDQDWTYLVYCHTDPPSTDSAQAIVDAGIKDVYRLEGNFIAWKNGGYPIET